jgi:hypothetical protein
MLCEIGIQCPIQKYKLKINCPLQNYKLKIHSPIEHHRKEREREREVP